jgi:cell division transport system permease protein
MGTLKFCLREAFVSLWQRRGTTLLSAMTIAVAMTVLGAFLVVTFNLNRAVAAWNAAAELTVYLRDDITAEQRADVNRMLAESPLVASRTYVSKEDALLRFKRDFPDLAASAAALEQNPMPASLDVRLTPALATTEEVEALATRLGLAPGVADVRFDRQWLARLSRLAAALGWAGWIVGGVLVLAAGLTVTALVRISLYERRDAVEIMQLMGAPVALLRGPLVVEGILHGGLGAAVAVVVVYGAHLLLRAQVAEALPGLVESGFFAYLPWTSALGLVAGGMAVGCLGGLAAARHVR